MTIRRLPRVIFGRDVAGGLRGRCAESGWLRPVVVSSPSQRFVEALAGGWQRIAIAAEHGPIDILLRALPMAEDADALIAIGGGSAIGLAKAMADRLDLPLGIVSTTFAGSALTDSFGLSEEGVKRVERSPRARAHWAIYDPALFDGFTGVTAAASAFNAMAHVIDAAFSGTPIDTTLAPLSDLKAMLPRQDGGPCDAGVRAASRAACVLAGAAGGAHHRLCHAIGGRFNTPHGLTHAILLPHTVALLGSRQPAVSAAIAARFAAEDAAQALHSLAVACGIDFGLGSLNVDRNALYDLAFHCSFPGVSGHALSAMLDLAWQGRVPNTS